MTDSSKAKIFLADKRGLNEDGSLRSYQTFNFLNFFNEHKSAFSDLYVLNDDTLAGGASTRLTVTETSMMMLLPVVGAINYKDGLGNVSLVNAGEIQLVSLPSGVAFEISNPYENELVNYLHFWVRSLAIAAFTKPRVVDFDLVQNKNKLLEVANVSTISGLHFKCSIGQFMGREEAAYHLKDSSNELFVFIIEGAFEVQGRLLHPRDGLALWDIDGEIELEALSNEAVCGGDGVERLRLEIESQICNIT